MEFIHFNIEETKDGKRQVSFSHRKNSDFIYLEPCHESEVDNLINRVKYAIGFINGQANTYMNMP